MEQKTERVILKKSKRGLIMGIVTTLIVAAALSEHAGIPSKLQDQFAKKFLTRFKLLNIEWTEQGSSNLSFKINSDYLWKMSQLKKGDPLFEINLDDLENRILKIPYIQSIQIQKHLSMGLAVQYKVYQAKAIATKNNRPWIVSTEGKWISPVEGGNSYPLDIPFLSGFDSLESALNWLKNFEKICATEGLIQKIQIHEINKVGQDIFALLQFKYSIQTLKVQIIFPDQERLMDKNLPLEKDKLFGRLQKTIQYLIKNNILVSRIDLRAGQKIVVNVGKRL